MPGPYRSYLGKATLIARCGLSHVAADVTRVPARIGPAWRARFNSNRHRCRVFTAATTTSVASASATRAQPFSREAQELV